MITETADAEDRQDMASLASGQDAALNQLMGRHAEKLFHYLLRVLQNEAEASDLAQESFVRVYLHRNRFQSGKKFSTWLYAIATNLARDRLRWRERHPQSSLEAENPITGDNFKELLPSTSLSPSESLERSETQQTIRDAVASLPEDLRVPLVLAEYEEQSQAEIAAILGCSIKAVEMRIYRARKQLRVQLQRLLR